MKWGILNKRHLKDVFLHSAGSGKRGDALYTLGSELIRSKQTEAALWWCMSLSKRAEHRIQTSQCGVRQPFNFFIYHTEVGHHTWNLRFIFTHFIRIPLELLLAIRIFRQVWSDINTLINWPSLTKTCKSNGNLRNLQICRQECAHANTYTYTRSHGHTQTVVWVPVESTLSRPNIATVTRLPKSKSQI